MQIRTELILYASVRLGGAIVSMVVFALIVKKLTVEDAASVFFLLFTFGFAISLLRNFCMFSANLIDARRRTVRLRRIALCAHSYGRLLPIVFLILVLVFSFQSLPLWGCPIAAILACAAGYDSDLSRAAMNRSLIYPWLVLAGNATTLFLILILDLHTANDVILAISLGWIATSAFGLYRWLSESRLVIRNRIPVSASSYTVTARPLLFAVLEGVILNAPFLGGPSASIGGARSIDLSIAIRMFSSSQTLFALIAHWSNSGRLWSIGRQLRIREEYFYSLLLVVTGLMSSMLFIFMFIWISQQYVSINQFGMFTVLLLGYCAYLSQSRFHGAELSNNHSLFVYVLIFILFMCLLVLLGSYNAPAWAFAILQGCTLFFIAISINILKHYKATND